MATDQELENRITRLESYVEMHKLNERLDSLEQWRYIILGATTVAGALFALFANEIKGLLSA